MEKRATCFGRVMVEHVTHNHTLQKAAIKSTALFTIAHNVGITYVEVSVTPEIGNRPKSGVTA